MSGQDWAPYVIIFGVAALVMWRLDRLGKQLEAVRDHLLVELGNEETASETLRSREWEKNERKKERRQFWIFWGVVLLAVVIWYAVSQH
jgi:type VI protein secretion system component VasF